MRLSLPAATERALEALTSDGGQAPCSPAGFEEFIFSTLIEHEAPATFLLGGDWMQTDAAETRR